MGLCYAVRLVLRVRRKPNIHIKIQCLWKATYEIEETNYFRHGGNFHDIVISNDRMKLFLDNNENILHPLIEQYIKKLKQLKA